MSNIPQVPRSLGTNNIYELALKRDIFFHHPYESFQPIVGFIRKLQMILIQLRLNKLCTA